MRRTAVGVYDEIVPDASRRYFVEASVRYLMKSASSSTPPGCR